MEICKRKPLAFFDSGVGGLPYLEITRKKLPDERFVYLADVKNFPYGEKKPIEIRRAVFKGIELLLKKEQPKLIVIACNTASVVSLSELRREFKIPFVGVVPAIKPAARGNSNGMIAVLATKRTIEEEYLQNLIDSFASDKEILKCPESKLVKLVEYQYFAMSREQWQKTLQKISSELSRKNVETVVLGCTHFTVISDMLEEVFNGMRIVDSRDGVSNQIVRVLKENGLLISGKDVNKNCTDRFYITGDDNGKENYVLFAGKYQLEFRGSIERL